ncbi:FAD binding domain-containing protein [Mortierella sp. GBAus27b]|nr:hypothetical protein BGX31_000052 [Mortierella sp. GBA43]KAI8357953.1 FAD binding domain-containing protein [Mortierella sp. GBAus27b]
MSSSASPKMDIPVLISGGGPTGLYAAVLLTKLGIPCRIIERHLETSPLSKALVLHSRTLEFFAMNGIIDKFLERGRKITTFNAYNGSKPAAQLPALVTKESHYGYGLFLEQHRSAAILTEELEALGLRVDRGWELMDTKVVEGPEGSQESWVETTIRRAIDGSNIRETESKILGTVETDPEEEGKKYETQVVRSRYLIAADGGKSAVRHRLNIAFMGRTLDNSAVLYDGQVECDIPFDDVTVVNGVNGHVMGVFPMHDGQVRIIVDNGTRTPEEHAALKSEDLTVEQLEALINPIIAPAKFKSLSCSWLTYYRVNERQAEHFSYKNKIFLAGDAAHVHSPAGGQGMNMGLQDSHNLAWKLALVLHGVAPESLLDTYETERKPVADGIIKLSAKLLEGAFSQDFFKRTFRKIAFTIGPYIIPYLPIRNNPVPMLMIRYHENSINRISHSQESIDEEFQVGTRARDSDLGLITTTSMAEGNLDNGESVRLHELMTGPGVFHIVVFTSDMLTSSKKTVPGTLIKGVETTQAKDLSDAIETHLKSWRAKWARKPANWFASHNQGGAAVAAAMTTDASLEAVLKVHVVASGPSDCCPPSSPRGDSNDAAANAWSDLNVLVNKPVGEGKVYVDRQGELHQKYGVTAKQGPGAIVIVRPDGYIGYRVLGTANSAWSEVDQYFGSILSN